MFGAIALKIAIMVSEAKARDKWLASLPEDEANRIRADEYGIFRENELHRRALEIAEAGRARNFWGK